MWGRKRQAPEPAPAVEPPPESLKESVRQTRIELAERSSVVVDLRDAELARLELLNEALAPVFAEVPPEVDLFDRGISRGDAPRLWIDAVAHVVMGRDKRHYRFVQDTRYGRKLLAASTEIKDIVEAVTHYVASRLIERERTLAEDAGPLSEKLRQDVRIAWRRQRWRLIRAFVFGLILGCVALFAALWILASRLQH
jgi:hypothetical protein